MDAADARRQPAFAVAVAVSGGRDSTALLHATVHAARAIGARVHALHVHHGLVAESDDWLRHLRQRCQRWARSGLPVVFDWRRLHTRPGVGDSIEAWARTQRYAALAEMAGNAGCSLVLLAHHRRDQAETLLLQALRGGGPAGLAAMPRLAQRAGITWARPWLAMPPEAIAAYVQRHRLRHIEDGSNGDPRFARNRLRSTVWPALVQAFPDAEGQLHAAAQRAAEAAACLAELAAEDAAGVLAAGLLDVGRWQQLSAARRAHLLRAWLGGPDSLVRRLCDELPAAEPAACWPAPGGALCLHDGLLRFVAAQPAAPTTAVALDLSRPGRYAVHDWHGHWLVQPVASGGVAPASLRQTVMRPRAGDEQFQFGPRSMARSLKKQYQSRRVPAWERSGPLLFSAQTLLFVPGLGLDARCLAAAGEPQLGVCWVPAAPS